MEDNGTMQGWVKGLESWIWIDFSVSVFMLGLFFYIFIHNPITRLHKAYLVFHFFMLLWPLSQFLLQTTTIVQYQLLFRSISYAGLSLQGLGWLVFVCFLTGRSYLLTRLTLALLAGPTALLAALVLAEPRQFFLLSGDGAGAVQRFGPLSWALLAQLMLMAGLSIACILSALRAGTTLRHRKQVGMALKGLLLFLLFGWLDLLVNVVYDSRFPDISGISSVGLALTALYFCVSIDRYRVFDIVRIAQQDIADSMSAGLLVLDAEGTVLEANRSLQRYLSVQSGDRFDLGAFLRSQKRSSGETAAELGRAGEAVAEPILQELVLSASDLPGAPLLHVQVHASPIVSGERELLGRVVTFQDVSEIRQLVEEKHRQNEMLQLRNRELVQIQEELFRANLKLEEMATTDSLTGCYNRRFLMQRLEQEVVANVRYRIPFAIILFDIDHFKGINDRHGHLVGDEVLLETATAVKGMLRRSDVLARYGGEEFAVYLPHTTRLQAERLAERLKIGVEANRVATGRPGLTLSITISLGVLSVENESPLGIKDPKAYLRELFEEADAALYEAKGNGRNCMVGRRRA
ncbi:diguanylate cyclase/phosphodiesterase (GGDEF & EAL domains) with PAS/PAC sensor(s) [Paenibacillus pasadenensis]|uniref:Diguanylate cyclase/phosphodiesterase (GGDEF & EAL domains) with PAS/PAC sensor(S) n=1 Tax=Paenibacillus pasadenensis TaxID=217090 RepID=A0A2N5NAM5_9BACL|nr:diguanylate cyclase/phosphodiesterase (GGDEF & EAL domains) with PAS/PAC sensor(s) [Paenibacillus pasadenensis]